MKRHVRVAAAIVASAALLVTTAACSGGGGSTSGPSAATGKNGGTLKVLANGDLDHYDPQLTAYVPDYNVMRAIVRPLLSYQASNDAGKRVELQPDLAESVPKPTDGGLTYTLKLRSGSTWDAPSGARAIVSGDVARGFKRLCNPVIAGAQLGYFQNLIAGMSEFCAGFQKVAPTAAAMKDYVESHQISGIDTSDPRTVVFHLTEQASDFPYMLSLDSTDPAPVESLDYIPDSPEYRQHFVASGPYKIKSYTPDVKLVLERNPAWKASSDPLRKAYVNEIDMTMGVEADAAMQQVQAGSADMLFDLAPSNANIQQLKAQNDSKLMTFPIGAVSQFMWINTLSNNNGGALKNMKVREALQYAVDKAAVVQIMGGSSLAGATNGIFGPGILGYKSFDPFPTKNDQGDPAKAKQLLAEAGYPNGLTLKMPYRQLGTSPDIAQTLQSSMAKAGITLQLQPVPPTDYYANFMTNPSNATSGAWDLAVVGWSPDWQGGAARSVFQPQFSYTGTPQTYNYVNYNSDAANKLATQALQASSPSESASLWHQVDVTVMRDSPIVSIAYQKRVVYRSARIQNFQIYAQSQNGDWTNLWLGK
jgi:peptide/nickel transport system substrate-binding protein